MIRSNTTDVRLTAKDHEEYIRSEYLSHSGMSSVPGPKTRRVRWEMPVFLDIEDRQQRRKRAGRSGGVFKPVDGTMEYERVWPDPLQTFVKDIQETLRSRPESIQHGHHHPLRSNPVSFIEARTYCENIESRTFAGLYEKEPWPKPKPEEEHSSPMKPFRKMKRKNSGLLKKCSNLGDIDQVDEDSAIVGTQPKTKTSPLKDQLAEEAARTSKHEFANKEFFTPTKPALNSDDRHARHAPPGSQYSDSEYSEDEVEDAFSSHANSRQINQDGKRSRFAERPAEDLEEDGPDWEVDAVLRRRSTLGL
jgi:hypothetical protein